MKIINTTNWPNWFIRRMLSWTLGELEMPIKHPTLRLASFRNSRSTWGGLCHGQHRIGVCVNKSERAFPQETGGHNIGGELKDVIADRLECLVWVTAHELAHVRNWRSNSRRGGSHGGSEALTDTLAFNILRIFREQRAALVAAWSAEPAVVLRLRAAPVRSVQELRAAKAAEDLARWQRKLKLAAGKVRKLRVRVKYYEQQLDARSAGGKMTASDNETKTT